LGRTTYSSGSAAAANIAAAADHRGRQRKVVAAGADSVEVTMVDSSGIRGSLEAARQGDGRAAEVLYHAYQPMLLRYLRSQEPRMADDIASEVWLAAAGALASFDGDESGFRAWLFTVARRRVIEHRRRGLRRRTDPVDPETFVETAGPADAADLATDLVDAQRAVDQMVRHLSADQSEVLILRVVADLSAAQVAELMGRPEDWVRTTQHRALKRLAAHLDARMEVTS
jgi:RNA polymerase sigma-70 factor (ECF subfamily)